MSFSQEEVGMFLSSAMTQYIFNKIFEDHNNGCSFDTEKFIADIQDLSSDPLFSLSKEKQAQLAEKLINLDQYAKIDKKESGKKLVLT